MKRVFFAAMLAIVGSVSASHAVTIKPCYYCEVIEFDPAMTIYGVWEGIDHDGNEIINAQTRYIRITQGAVGQTQEHRPGFVPVGTPLTNLSSNYVDVQGENYLWMTIAGTRVGIDFTGLAYDENVFFYAMGNVVSDGLTRLGRKSYFFTKPGTFDDSPLGFAMYFTADPVNVPLPPMVVVFGLSILALTSLRRLQAPRL